MSDHFKNFDELFRDEQDSSRPQRSAAAQPARRRPEQPEGQRPAHPAQPRPVRSEGQHSAHPAQPPPIITILPIKKPPLHSFLYRYAREGSFSIRTERQSPASSSSASSSARMPVPIGFPAILCGKRPPRFFAGNEKNLRRAVWLIAHIRMHTVISAAVERRRPVQYGRALDFACFVPPVHGDREQPADGQLVQTSLQRRKRSFRLRCTLFVTARQISEVKDDQTDGFTDIAREVCMVVRNEGDSRKHCRRLCPIRCLVCSVLCLYLW